MDINFFVKFFRVFGFDCFGDEIVCFVKIVVKFESEYIYGRYVMVDDVRFFIIIRVCLDVVIFVFMCGI